MPKWVGFPLDPYGNSRQKSGFYHGQLGPAEGLHCHGDKTETASVSNSGTPVMGSQLMFPVFSIFLLSSEIDSHCGSADPPPGWGISLE